MESCLDHVDSVLLCALEPRDAFRLLRCSRRLRRAVGRSRQWAVWAEAYGYINGNVSSMRLMRSVLHGGPACLNGKPFAGLTVDKHALGKIHRGQRHVTYVTRSGTMWALSSSRLQGRYLCSVGHQITSSAMEAASGIVVTTGLISTEARDSRGIPVEIACMAHQPPVRSLRVPHVIPSVLGSYIAHVGGTISQALWFVPHSDPSAHVLVTRCMMPYVHPALVHGGILFASLGRICAWNEETRTCMPIILPNETFSMMPRSITVTGMGRPIVVTNNNVHVLHRRPPFASKFVCPLPLTHNVFSTPRVLGELVVGCYVANQRHRWVLDATTGRRCTHPYMHAMHGVIDGNCCVAHVCGRGVMAVPSNMDY